MLGQVLAPNEFSGSKRYIQFGRRHRIGISSSLDVEVARQVSRADQPILDRNSANLCGLRRDVATGEGSVVDLHQGFEDRDVFGFVVGRGKQCAEDTRPD